MTEIIGRKVAYKGYVTVTVAMLKPKDGEAHPREVVSFGDSACVLPYDPDRRVAMVIRMPRAPRLLAGEAEPLLEAVAGMVDAGETPAEAAIREAMEEAGLALKAVETVATAWPSPGVLAERSSLFLAAYSPADRTGTGGGVAGEHEAITLAETPLAELAAMADAGRLADLKTLTLVQTLRLRRPELFAEP
jgi:nudix-type nucleoside diphosphatase (YffH/AdpP family)